MSFTVIIPARYASSRLPGKPLLEIAGKPMIQHVYEQALSSQASRVIIATDDERVATAAKAFNADVCMTSADHESGTDRLEEVVRLLKLDDDEIIVNVQGDEPLLPPAVIDQLADKLKTTAHLSMATLVEAIDNSDDLFDPNVVKVTIDQSSMALYFSRAPIPWFRDGWNKEDKILPDSIAYWRHIGIYAYRVSFLKDFVAWPPSPLELTEKLEQLRALDNGVRIHVAEAVEKIPAGVDTEADLLKVRQIIEGSK
jgi:3-deoxy-manno-octulosonate cytidylyltransferase (CMP-KDO synthetase)